MWEVDWRKVAIITAVVVVGVAVTLATAGAGTALVGAAVGAAGLTGTAATAATVVGAVATGAAAGATGSWAATATGQVATGTYNAPGAAEERSTALKSGAVAGALTAGVGAALGAVGRGGVAGARAVQAANQASRAAQLGTRVARGVALGATAGATYEASRQQFSGERKERGGFDFQRIEKSAAFGAAVGGVTETIAGPALNRMGDRLFQGGYQFGGSLRASPVPALSSAATQRPCFFFSGEVWRVSARNICSGQPLGRCSRSNKRHRCSHRNECERPPKIRGAGLRLFPNGKSRTGASRLDVAPWNFDWHWPGRDSERPA